MRRGVLRSESPISRAPANHVHHAGAVSDPEVVRLREPALELVSRHPRGINPGAMSRTPCPPSNRWWWAHLEFTRINIKPIILQNKIEDLSIGAHIGAIGA